MQKLTVGGQSAVTWVLLSDARALVVDAYQMQTRGDFHSVESSPAENMLRNALADGRVRSRGLRFERTLTKDAPQRPPSFEDLRTVWEKGAWINWQTSSADCVFVRGVLPGSNHPVYGPDGTTYHRIEVAREDLLKLLPEGYELPFELPLAKPPQVSTVPEAAPTQSKGLKRGRKGYSEEELKPFELKFYELLYENDVKAGAEISIDRYAEDLMDWGKRNELKTPGRTKMTGQIEKWRMTWLEYKSFNK
jgi:hypothetical protein